MTRNIRENDHIEIKDATSNEVASKLRQANDPRGRRFLIEEPTDEQLRIIPRSGVPRLHPEERADTSPTRPKIKPESQVRLDQFPPPPKKGVPPR